MGFSSSCSERNCGAAKSPTMSDFLQISPESVNNQDKMLWMGLQVHTCGTEQNTKNVSKLML